MKKYLSLYVFSGLVSLSTFAALFFVSTQQNLMYGDALSRLNIARKITDNLTPGLAQLGNVWLPFPQLLMFPFTMIGFLWHSGIAGAFPSMVAFIIGGFYIYKSINLITKSNYAAIFGAAIYALNINLLYLQTTAMSEAIFISLSSLAIYCALRWSRTLHLPDLLFLASVISLTTLTRYEGLALLASYIVFVFAYSFFKARPRLESNTIIFCMLACLGFALWTLYLTAIFGDPLYWKNYYIAPHETESGVRKFAENLPLLDAIFKYFVSVVWMNGIIPVALASLGLIFFIFDSIRKRNLNNVSLLIPLSIFVFMVYTLTKNTPIRQPDLTWVNILSGSTSKIPEFNIRYGLILLPIISIFAAYLLRGRYKIINLVLTLLFLVQIVTYFYPRYTLIYSLPTQISGNGMQGGEPARKYLAWLKSHYDGGLIMVSTLKHDPQMFQSGLEYKTFIHEGTGKYWKASIKDPSKYATWVIFYYNNREDQVTKYLKNSNILKDKYDLVYNILDVRIYKIKTKPQFEIQ